MKARNISGEKAASAYGVKKAGRQKKHGGARHGVSENQRISISSNENGIKRNSISSVSTAIS